jgi:aminobenzoyl-glutamate utilization protein B
MRTKHDLIQWLEAERTQFTHMADEIWAYAEVAWREFRSSKLQADYLANQGFHIAWDIADINTSFVAQWGAGHPIIGFAGEYDALAGLSQTTHPYPESRSGVEAGHACGHNLLGTGCLAAAVAVKEWLQATGTTGTVRYYGCPAEERTSGKTFMARAGTFDDLDAAFNYHPDRMNMPSKGTNVGVQDLTFRFHGTAAHAGGSPHRGRSALDAVELMNVGVNYLREHVSEKVRMHYVITHGGDLPNVVPAEAEVWYFLRALEREELDQVAHRVQKIAQGAALMTETTMEQIFNGACSSVLNNHYLAELQYQAMQRVGPIEFTEQERAYAQQINDAYPEGNARDLFKDMEVPPSVRERLDDLRRQPLLAENFQAMDERRVATGSTDVGDLSWITPLSMLRTACFPTRASGHSWGIVAASGTSIGHKGMMHAAKIMAVAALDLYADSRHLQRARSEFDSATSGRPYESPLPEALRPPQYAAPEGG